MNAGSYAPAARSHPSSIDDLDVHGFATIQDSDLVALYRAAWIDPIHGSSPTHDDTIQIQVGATIPVASSTSGAGASAMRLTQHNGPVGCARGAASNVIQSSGDRPTE